MVNVNHVGEQKGKQEQSIHHAVQHHQRVKDQEKEKHGAKLNNK
jgi:hypothetical protein